MDDRTLILMQWLSRLVFRFFLRNSLFCTLENLFIRATQEAAKTLPYILLYLSIDTLATILRCEYDMVFAFPLRVC